MTDEPECRTSSLALLVLEDSFFRERPCTLGRMHWGPTPLIEYNYLYKIASEIGIVYKYFTISVYAADPLLIWLSGRASFSGEVAWGAGSFSGPSFLPAAVLNPAGP